MADLAIEDLMAKLPSAFLPEKAAGVNAVVQFNLSGERGGDWYVTIHDQACTVEPGAAQAPNLVFSAAAQDCLDILTGKLDGMRAFMTGKLKLSGDMGLAMKLVGFFRLDEENRKALGF